MILFETPNTSMSDKIFRYIGYIGYHKNGNKPELHLGFGPYKPNLSLKLICKALPLINQASLGHATSIWTLIDQAPMKPDSKAAFNRPGISTKWHQSCSQSSIKSEEAVKLRAPTKILSVNPQQLTLCGLKPSFHHPLALINPSSKSQALIDKHKL